MTLRLGILVDMESTAEGVSQNAHDKERSLKISLIINLLLFLPDVAAAVIAHSVTLYADLLKTFNELIATLLAWVTIRSVSRGKSPDFNYGLGKLENLASIAVALFMFVSTYIVLHTALDRLSAPVALHPKGVWLAIVTMLVGMVVNIGLFWKNHSIAQREHSPVMRSQVELFRAKAVADGLVLLSMIATLALKNHPLVLYLDPVACLMIAVFLLFSSLGLIWHSMYDLLDQTLDESLQLVIVRELVAFYHDYVALNGVRSRRSGSRAFIEIYLDFDSEKTMGEVQRTIDRMQQAIESRIKNSQVLIIPSTRRVSNTV